MDAAAGESLGPDVHERLVHFAELLVAAPLNVTAIRDVEDAIARLVGDSLRGLAAIDRAPAGPLADVGSGGGVPGLVLALARPAREVHLFEATTRKADFIERVARELEATVRVHAARSEEAARGAARDAFACVCARALAPPPVAAELCLPLARGDGGRVVLWTASSIDRAALERVCDALAARLLDPALDGLAELEKHGPTPDRFPRRPGMAAKRPLAGD